MTKKQRVLIVDDEPRNQRILSEILGDQFELQMASTGEEALRVIDGFSPDLVLLDIMMPGKDGYDVCKEIRTRPALNLTKVILVSGKAMIEERLKGYEAGADDYITKPFFPEELLAKTRVFLRLTSMERESEELNRTLDEKVKERTHKLLQAEAMLINSAKLSALGEMAGGIAHQVNSPLGTIWMAADQLQEMILEDPLDRPAIAEMARSIVETVKSISAIVRDLRTFSQDGRKEGFQSVGLRQIVESTLNLCREKMKSQKIQIHVDLPPEDVRFQCQSIQVSHVLFSLINNACDAIALLHEKWIRISADQQEDSLRLTITDSGKGIPQETREKIFEPFFTTKEVGKGAGLGLCISQRIIDMHHGSLTLDSKNENTCFVLRLPLRQDHLSV